MNESSFDPLEPFVINSCDPRVQGQVPILEVIPPTTFQPLSDPRHLDSYSLAFFKFLCERHPEWRAAFQIGTTGEEKFLYVEVPCPSPHLNPMWISSEESRITVGFGKRYHAHFATYPPDTDGEMFEGALSFIGDVMQEKLLILCLMAGGTSWSQYANEEMSMPRGYSSAADQSIRVCSWSTTFDRVVEVKKSD